MSMISFLASWLVVCRESLLVMLIALVLTCGYASGFATIVFRCSASYALAK